MGGYPRSGGAPFSLPETSGVSVLSVIEESTTTARWTFSSDIVDSGQIDGLTINGHGPVNDFGAEGDSILIEYALPFPDGSVWAVDLPNVTMEFANGLPLLPGSGDLNG